MFSGVADDAGVAWRGLVRRPFYAVATVVMLALAVGANAVAFGIYYGVEIRDLPYAKSGRLVMLRERIPKVGLDGPMLSPRDYAAMVRSVPGIAAAGMWTFGGDVASVIGGRARAVSVSRVTPSWFGTLGVVPALGRLPSVSAGERGGPGEVMISYKFWQTVYGGRGSVLGRSITLGNRVDRIVGVLPRGYGFEAQADALVPLVMPMSHHIMDNINDFVVARLRSGVTVGELNLQIDRLKGQLLRYRATDAKMPLGDFKLDARALRPMLISLTPVSIFPLVLQFMALLLLGLAIANAANLAIVRQRVRLGEFALRRVLGASRGAVMRLLLLEQAPIVAIAGLLAIGIAFVALRVMDDRLGLADDLAPLTAGFGWPVVVCAIGLTLVSGVAIVAVPIRQITRRPLDDGLGQGAKSSLGRAARMAQRGLGTVQIVLASALLVGSLALGLSLFAVLHQTLGFSPRHRVVASVLLPAAANNPASIAAMTAGLRADPAFMAVGGLDYGTYPFSSDRDYTLARRVAPGSKSYHANYASVGEGYFRALGMTVQSGRRFSATEYHDGSNVIIVGAGFARRVFGTERVVGRLVNLGRKGETYRIVGVARPVVWRATPWRAAPGTMYLPITSFEFPGFRVSGAHVVIDYRGSLVGALKQSRAIIGRAVPGAVVLSVRSYRRIIFDHEAFRVIAAAIAAAFAAIALVVAGLGVYAVNAFIARARLPEFGMRAMLGASPGRLLRLALGDAAWLLGFGLAGGAVGGYLLIRAMSPLLFRIGEIGPLVFAVSLVVVSAIVLGAAWRPAAVAARTPVKRLLEQV